MKDLIIYISDLTKFRVEAQEIFKTKGTALEHAAAKFLSVNQNGDGLLFNACKIPVLYSDDKSLCLVRTADYDDLDGTMGHLEIIGECVDGEYKFRAYGKDKYESTYDTNPRMIDDGEGGEIEYTPPYMIGVFA